MKTIILLLSAVLPAALLWLYVWWKDPQKEPTGLLVKAILYGIGIVWIAGGIEVFIKYSFWAAEDNALTLWDTTAMAFLVAAIPEECFKLLALWLILRRNPYFDEHFDGIIYAVSIGLGFAAMENIGYVMMGGDDWLRLAISRALLSVPGHYAFAVLMGYYYSLYHFVERSTRNKVCILLVPVLAHGIYDSLAMSGMADPTVGGICAFVLIYFCIKMHKFAHKKVLAQIERDQANHMA